jgi:hypothetical protein
MFEHGVKDGEQLALFPVSTSWTVRGD